MDPIELNGGMLSICGPARFRVNGTEYELPNGKLYAHFGDPELVEHLGIENLGINPLDVTVIGQSNKLSLSAALGELAHILTYLTARCRHPEPDPLTEQWAYSVKTELRGARIVAVDAARKAGRADIVQEIEEADRLALEWIALLIHRISLSAVRVEEWTFDGYRQRFDRIEELSDELRELVAETLPLVQSR